MPERDWNRIEAELDAACPGKSEISGPASAHQIPEVAAQPDEEQILRHIADALRLDTVQ